MINNRLSEEEKKEAYQNTKLLLEQYGTVRWRLNQDMNEMSTVIKNDLDTDLFCYIDILADIDVSQKSKRLKSRLSSLENSKSMVCMIDKAVKLLKSYPTKGDLYFHLIADRYLAERSKKVENILSSYSISRRTYYRDVHKATEIIGIILWGFTTPYLLKLKSKNK